jgi:hypothetical protein
MNPDDADGIRRARWVQQYRLSHRGADRWANGTRGIVHSIETQDRIFRLAEQLHDSQNWPHAVPFFVLLRAVDEAASYELGLQKIAMPASAAAAAVVGFKVLFGQLPRLNEHDWADGVDLTSQADVPLATFGLRLRGFDPVVFDGHDPAAYLWALYEIQERNAACDGRERRGQQPIIRPHGLAVIRAKRGHRAPARVAPLAAPRPAALVGK